MSRVVLALHVWRRSPPRPSDGYVLALVGLLLRLAVVAWAHDRFVPIADGHFYHVLAERMARGYGYTWLWPDGAVTPAAHYPVGYPALLGSVYAVVGPTPSAAMVLNALVGATAVLSVHRLSATVASRAGAAVAACSIAFHPGLVLYTPALMTEGVSASLYVILAAEILRPRPSAERALKGGLLCGAATLVRPQSILLGPALAMLWQGERLGRRVRVALGAVLVAVIVCLPWTLRNCASLDRCVFVSANAGWNLLIGAAPGATGAWVGLEQLGVPDSCRDVFEEAEKDRCFGLAAAHRIAQDPLRWVSLVPHKLAATFDYGGAAGWYLHESNAAVFDKRDKFWLGATETLYQRVLVLLAAWTLFRIAGPRAGSRRVVLALSAIALLTKSAWVAYLGIAVAAALLGRRLAGHPPAAASLVVIATTALVHAAFFGAGRYSLVCYPILGALAGARFDRGLDDRQ